MMWSLTMPKVAATLVPAFIGYEAGLLNQTVLNSVLAVMVRIGHPGADPPRAVGDPAQVPIPMSCRSASVRRRRCWMASMR